MLLNSRTDFSIARAFASTLLVAFCLSVALAGLSAVEANRTKKVFRWPDGIQNIVFTSKLDGKEDKSLYLAPPTLPAGGDVTLFVYHHGMNGFPLEALANCPDDSIAERYVALTPSVFLSMSAGKKAAWGNDAAIADITSNVREVLKRFKVTRIILVGTSMGGTVMMNFAAEAPPDIKRLIRGVVAIEAASDMSQLQKTSDDDGVRRGIIDAFGGSPDTVPAVYRRKSPIVNLKKIAKDVRVAFIYATADKIVPTPLQLELVEAVKKQGLPVDVQVIKGGHGIPSLEAYINAARFAIGK